MFANCRNLKQVALNEGLETLEIAGKYNKTVMELVREYDYDYEYSSDDYIYGYNHDYHNEYYEPNEVSVPYGNIFEGSGVEEIVLPSTLKKVCGDVF